MPSSGKKSKQEAERQVRSWGFDHVFTWTDPPNAYYSPHSHAGLTTHLIIAGELTIRYPDDHVDPAKGSSDRSGDQSDRTDARMETKTRRKLGEDGKETFGVGDRVDVDAGRRHEVWMGEQGCTYVIGE